MTFKIVVVVSFDIWDIETSSFTIKTESKVFDSNDEASDYIKTIGYPYRKISIFVLHH